MSTNQFHILNSATKKFVDKNKVQNNSFGNLSENLEKLKEDPQNRVIQKNFIKSVWSHLRLHYSNKVSFDDFESIVQDTSLKVITKIISGENITEGIIRNCATSTFIDLLKFNNAKKRNKNTAIGYNPSCEHLDAPIEHKELLEIMKNLPNDEFKILDEYYFKGSTYKKISNLTGKSVSTIHRDHKKSLNMLKKLF